MSEMEKNRQIVQDGLNKRKAKRKKAEEEAFHEAITNQMFNIVDNNAHNANTEEQIEIDRYAAHRAEQLRNKRIAYLKETRNDAVIDICLALIFIAISIICYATKITALWPAIVLAVPSILLFVGNAYFVVSDTIEIAKLM